MGLQAGTGRLWADQYRDVPWIRATFIGNDWLTLLVALPVLVAGLLLARHGRPRGWLLWFGALWYAVYNYAFYLFGTVVNPFFLLYVIAFVLAGLTLAHGLAVVETEWLADQFDDRLPRRTLGGYLIFVAAGLSLAWIGLWATHVFGGAELPVEEEAFRLVAALDLGLMVPALTGGGLLLWRGRPLGYLIAPMAAIQGALYLAVLAVNAMIHIDLGFTDPPGEAPVWGGLAIATLAAAGVMIWHARGSDAG